MLCLFSPFGQARGWKLGSPRGEKDAGADGYVPPLPVGVLAPPTMGPWALTPDV